MVSNQIRTDKGRFYLQRDTEPGRSKRYKATFKKEQSHKVMLASAKRKHRNRPQTLSKRGGRRPYLIF